MDDWDPMRDAYNNRQFNCYNQGVGRDLSGSGRHNKGVCLFVKNIPPSLGKVGFFNMFAEYGKVIKHALITSAEEDTWGAHGYVTYENILDAETAISHLDKKKLGHFTLKVSPALTEEERERRRKLKQDGEMIHSSFHRDTTASRLDTVSPAANFHSYYEHTQDRSSTRMNESSPQMSNSDFKLKNGGNWHQQSKVAGVGRGNIFQRAECEDTLHRPLHNIERGEHQKHLAYHPMQPPHGCQNLCEQECYSDAYNVAKKSIISPPKRAQEDKSCLYCSKEGCVNRCSNCKQYYCSPVCQKMDWPRHMPVCITIGELLQKGTLFNSNSNKNQMENSGFCFDDDVQISHSQLRNSGEMLPTHKNSCSDADDLFEKKEQCKKNLGEYYKRELSTSSENVVSFGHGAKPYNSGSMNRNTVDRDHKVKTTVFDKTQTSQIVNSSNSCRIITSSSHQGSSNRHENEKITAQGSHTYSKPADRNNSHAKDFKSRDKNSTTHPVSANLYQETPVRDMGLPSKPKDGESKGNESLDSKSKHKQESPDSKSKHKQESPDSKRQSTSLAKQIQNVKEDRNTDTEAATVKANETLPSAVELTLDVKASGQCCLTYFESPYKFWISLQEYLEVFTETMHHIGQVVSKASAVTPVECKVGQTYAVMYMGEWCRVTITSVKGKEITAFFIDYGNQGVVKPEDLKPLPVELLQLPAQAVCCCISRLKPKGSDSWSRAACSAVQQWLGEPMSKFLQFEVMAKRGSVHAVEISLNNRSMSDVLLTKNFAERVKDQPGLPNVASNPTSKPIAASLASRMDGVKIGDTINGILVDLTSVEKFIVLEQTSTDLMNELTSALHSEYNDSTVPYRPVQGELVAAQFSHDGKWYRAEVTSIDGDSCTLYFVDYGNSEVQKVENIRQLTNKRLIAAPKQALVCSLFAAQSLAGSSSSSKIVTQGFTKLLSAAVTEEGCVSLLVKGKTNNAILVDIIAKSGQSLSSELTQKLLEISTATPTKNCDRISKKQTNKCSSPPSKTSPNTLSDLGTENLIESIGDTVNVVVSFVKNQLEFYVRLNSKSKLFIDMMKELNRSVASSPRLTVPSVGTLTAVQASENGVWHRAVVEKINDRKCLVSFLDYGNSEEVSLTDLKVLPTCVCHLPAQAIRCRLSEKLKNICRSSILEFKKIEKSHVDVKVHQHDSGFFSVQVFKDGIDVGASLTDSDNQHTVPVEPTSAVRSPEAVLDIVMATLPAGGEPVSAIVTHIDSCSRLFISCMGIDVAELIVNLNKSADALPPLSNPVVGSSCAAQYSQDGTWYRASITEMKSTKTCIVQFLDFGNSEETLISNLKELSPDMNDLPGQAICCCLFGYEWELSPSHIPLASATEWINKLRNELLEKRVLVKAVNRKCNTWIVTMENEHGECIHTKYQPTTPEVAVTPKFSDLTFDTPSESEFEAFFLHINSLSDFYCQIHSNEVVQELDALSEQLRDDVSHLGEDILIDPVVNGIYTSKFSTDWYRCVVEEVRKTKVLIRYIDYGNSEEVCASQLRPLRLERLQMPVRLLRCKLYGVTPVQENWSSPDLADYLAFLQQTKIHLVVESKDTDFFHVSLFMVEGGEKLSIAAHLVDKGIAKFLQVVSPQKDETRSLLPEPVKPPQQAANNLDEDDDDDEGGNDAVDEETELQRKIQELQKQLMMSKQKKKQK